MTCSLFEWLERMSLKILAMLPGGRCVCSQRAFRAGLPDHLPLDDRLTLVP